MRNGLTDIPDRIDTRKGITQAFIHAQFVCKLHGLRRYAWRDRIRIIRKFSRLVQYIVKMNQKRRRYFSFAAVYQEQCQPE